MLSRALNRSTSHVRCHLPDPTIDTDARDDDGDFLSRSLLKRLMTA